jgi:4a-hydroxytetrahydrobiopterin dehydratase
MAERITPKQFHDSVGIDDWRVLWSVAFALYRTDDFATGLKLVKESADSPRRRVGSQ